MTRKEMKKIFNKYINLEVGDLMELDRGRMQGKIGIIKEIILRNEDGEEWEEYLLQVENEEHLFNSSEAFFFHPEIKVIEKT